MTIDLEIGGRAYRAVVAATPSDSQRLRIRLVPLDGDGAAIDREIDVRPTGAGYVLVQADGHVIDAAVAPAGPRDHWLVQLAGVDLDVAVNGRRHDSGTGAGVGAGEQRVSAPMPGRVLRVLVEAGAPVTAGQPLVIVEAMKMENALTSARDGVVQDVAVVEGASVEAGRLLMRIV